jgi:hypothetical protein
MGERGSAIRGEGVESVPTGFDGWSVGMYPDVGLSKSFFGRFFIGRILESHTRPCTPTSANPLSHHASGNEEEDEGPNVQSTKHF